MNVEDLKNNKYVRFIMLTLAIYIFLLSIQIMGDGFKTMEGFSETLISSTSNPVVALFIGILATSIIQSSSATTSIVVAMVAATTDLKTGYSPFLPNAIPIVMGANIGTSVTNLLVSIGHMARKAEFAKAFAAAVVHDIFNIIAVCIFFPLELITRAVTGTGLIEGIAIKMAGPLGSSGDGIEFLSPVKAITTPISHAILDVAGDHGWIAILIGLALLFLTLKMLVDSLKWLAETRIQKVLDEYLFGTPLIAFAFGIGLTAMVQSSSITTSFAVPLVGGGLLSIEQIFPFMLGANIGTTVTAMLAALATTSVAAVTIAMAHLIFNVFGTVAVYPFKKYPINISKKLGDYVSENKKMAFLYIIVIFYVIPLLVIGISRVI